MAQSYYTSFELPVVVVRPFNTYGPRQSARAFIPTVVSQALTQDRIVMGSLDPIRDMTYVKDTAEGFIQVGLADKTVGQVINLGVGQGRSIGEFTGMILKLLGKEDLPIVTDASRIRPSKSEVMRLISNNQKAFELSGWKPRYTMEQGLSETILWIRSHMDRYKPDMYAV